MKLSVLDQSPIKAGGTPAEAIAETLELARLCDRLGYHRYWVAEHHASEGLAGTAPEILITRIAAETRHLRVGSGGVMLSHYSSLKVAEQFRVLETLYPGRIDLGIGRAPGSDGRTAMALQTGPYAHPIEQFPNRIADLVDWLGGTMPGDHPFAKVPAQPAGPTMPELWILGSSGESARFAAHFGLAFSHAHFISGRIGVEAMAFYRQHFQASTHLATPSGSIGVFALVADTETEAQRLASSRDLWRLRLDKGELGPIPTVEEAASYPYSEFDRAAIERNRRRQIVGAPEQVKAKLVELAGAYGVEEAVIVSICHDPAARRRSYALLAEACALPARAAA
ncbi:MAG: LLM class flavin-dependent oxidoreductase [Alphaproteobacteria bacterium]|nr:LLM class flavin-dependent oxidoreductase [Alphaproteobacteria bacterium]